jgi:hypothetical protein
LARRYNVHLGMHGSSAQMVERAGELRQLGFDKLWLGPVDRPSFDRALELLPQLRAL